MTKKIGIIFVLFIVGITAMYIQMGANTKVNNKEESKNENIIGNINKITLSKTNYEYIEEIKGYKYEPVELSSNAIEVIKEELTGLKLENNAEGIVYGKYKLELDDNTIYFDLNNDIALLKNKNYIIKLNNSFKKQILSNKDICSCCTDDDCLINLCACKEGEINE